MASSSSEYNRKRNFDITAEPPDEDRPRRRKTKGALSFVIQKHDARRLHYDFRLELEGTLKSWAVPKGPSLDPGEKRLAVQVEDHPLAYGSFEGSIPEGQYGAGDVIVWDRGEWQVEGDAAEAYAAGKLKFELRGEKLRGHWTLVRTRLQGHSDKPQWLLIKERDAEARDTADYEVTTAEPDSVLSDKTLPRLAQSRTKSTSKGKITTEPKATRTPARQATAKARKAKLPETLEAQLATLVDSPPAGDWLYEVKYDGYRLLGRIEDGEVRLFTRSGNDWTERLPEQARALADLGLENAWLDGEIVVNDAQGVSSFQALQNAFETGKATRITYYLFDLPYLNGTDLREVPVEQRRELLGKLLEESNDSELLRFSAAFEVPAERILASACELGLEGVIGKRLGSAYRSRRNKDWIKLKCAHRQEFIIVGYTPPKGGRQHLGALLVALHDDQGRLHYAGKVGTGFTAALLKQLHARFQPLIVDQPPVVDPPRGAAYREVTWLRPEQLCEIAYAELTQDRIVRQGVFHGLRDDKPAEGIGLEQATPAREAERPDATSRRKPGAGQREATVAGVRISHPERVIDEASGARKLDVAGYYAAVADWILPHLADRPVALVRTPEGIAGEQIFQKHKQTLAIPHIRELDPTLDPGHAPLMVIDSREALLGAAQMGTVELHTWNATAARIDRPDRFILDLDPDPALPWSRMVEATELVLTLLDELDLQAFVKTSGGRGLHLVVPLDRRQDWDTVKAFAQAAAQHLANTLPQLFAAKMGAQNRQGKIFVDYLRNRHGATTVSAFSLRARPHLGVSVPVARDELTDLQGSDQWRFDSLLQRLEGLKDDPWAGYAGVRQSLTATRRKRLGVA